MIEARYPGVFLSESAFSAKPIEGVSTSTSDLAGMTSFERLAHISRTALPDPAARTVSFDPEFRYVNLRRDVAYLEESIKQAIQFAVFEPNGEALWQNVRAAVEDFLLNEWQSGVLQGARPEQAYFVKCDRSTMTQNDLDNGRLVVLVGVATVKPAEFVVLRISAKTASAGN